MYSSIEDDARYDVIQKCYWPLVKLAENGIPIGIEASAVTLEIINKLDPDWIGAIKKYIHDGKIEFVGSGYSQIIGPLVPAEVNQWNQKLGLDAYQNLLDVTPELALVNEMAYSAGIVEHYLNAGYKAIIMEWNNPRSAHPVWNNEWRYYPQYAIGCGGKSIPLVWADSIAFQKFQRYIHKDIELEEYLIFLKSHLGNEDRYFPLYSNDVEIFDYRPGRYQTEAAIEKHSEWQNIVDLYQYLEKQDWCEFVFPSEALRGLSHPNGGKQLQLESPSHPIPVKKQEKYNINRWALTGRDDLGINTKCYQIYHSFARENNENQEDWIELCYLWSSDFRTHITEKRWDDYKKQLKNACSKWVKKDKKSFIQNNKRLSINDTYYSSRAMERFLSIENDKIRTVLNKHKGLTIKECVYKNISEKSLFGTLNHGYYDDITFGADYYSGHAVIERPGEHKVTDLGKVNPIVDHNTNVIISTQKWSNYSFKQKIKFLKKKLVFEKQIKYKTSEKVIIRPFSFTINPDAWDRNSLYVATHNGGLILEKFYLMGQNISQGDIYSSLISARHGFGNTEGIFSFGDNDKSLTIECDMSTSALIPSIIFKEMDGTYFCRLQYSAREMDETMKKISKSILSKISLKFE